MKILKFKQKREKVTKFLREMGVGEDQIDELSFDEKELDIIHNIIVFTNESFNSLEDTNIPRLIKAFDVLVLTSLHEGLPMVIPQAMAAKIPVVVTNVDGAPDAIDNGVSGFLVEPKDIESHCEKVLKILENPDLSEKLIHKSFSKVHEFDIMNMIDFQQKFYLEALESITKF